MASVTTKGKRVTERMECVQKAEREKCIEELDKYRLLHEASDCDCKEEVLAALSVAIHRLKYPNDYDDATGLSKFYLATQSKTLDLTGDKWCCEHCAGQSPKSPCQQCGTVNGGFYGGETLAAWKRVVQLKRAVVGQ